MPEPDAFHRFKEHSRRVDPLRPGEPTVRSLNRKPGSSPRRLLKWRSSLAAGLVLWFLAPGAQSLLPRAEAQERSLVDRVAAVVGDSVIVLSQIEERIFQIQAQGAEIPARGSDAWVQLQRDVLDQMIGEQLIVQAASKDTTIVVDDIEVENMVSEDINRRMAGMADQSAFEQGLARQGFTLAGYRDFLRGQIRQQRLYQQYMAKRAVGLSSIVVEQSEIEDFFQQQKEAIGDRPPTVVFAQIILAPEASDSVWEAARARADTVRQMAMDGQDFAELARRFSDDGSAESGGDLGWFRRGDMVEEFEEAAFNLAVNEVSQPVRSPFGYHLIKLDRRRAGEVRASHILFRVVPSPADVETTRELAVSLKARLEAGEDFAALREEYGMPREPDTLRVPFNQLRELPPGYAEPLSQADPGQILDPIQYSVREEQRLAVVEVLDVLPAAPYTLEDEDLRSRIVETLQQQKLVDQILEELRSKTYVQIRM